MPNSLPSGLVVGEMVLQERSASVKTARRLRRVLRPCGLVPDRTPNVSKPEPRRFGWVSGWLPDHRWQVCLMFREVQQVSICYQDRGRVSSFLAKKRTANDGSAEIACGRIIRLVNTAGSIEPPRRACHPRHGKLFRLRGGDGAVHFHELALGMLVDGIALLRDDLVDQRECVQCVQAFVSHSSLSLYFNLLGQETPRAPHPSTTDNVQPRPNTLL